MNAVIKKIKEIIKIIGAFLVVAPVLVCVAGTFLLVVMLGILAVLSPLLIPLLIVACLLKCLL
jgi:hypothetical protein